MPSVCCVYVVGAYGGGHDGTTAFDMPASKLISHRPAKELEVNQQIKHMRAGTVPTHCKHGQWERKGTERKSDCSFYVVNGPRLVYCEFIHYVIYSHV